LCEDPGELRRYHALPYNGPNTRIVCRRRIGRGEHTDPAGSGQIKDEFFEDGIGTEDVSLVPMAHLHMGSRFSRRVGAFVEFDAGGNSDDQYLDAAAKLQFFFGKRWEMQLGYRRIDRKLDAEEL
jgi:hypothetical protein